MTTTLQEPVSVTATPPAVEARVMFSIRDLDMVYSTKSGSIHALSGINLDVRTGSFVSIVGASGCGKSTLLRLLAGLEEPTGGSIRREGVLIDGASRDVSIAFQDHVLSPWLTILENVMLPTQIYGTPPHLATALAHRLLKMSGLAGFEHHRPADLSGGMKQRAALCRTLVTEPAVLLLDEPFGALDALTREELSLELLRLWEETRKTAVLITHDINESVMLSDTVVVMSPRPGRILEVVPIDLPRPRGPHTELLPRYAELTHHIRELIFARRKPTS